MKQNKHLFLRALNGEQVERPPVWMMRQAGRYLPEYMALRAKYDFFTRIKTPDLVSEITIQPIDIVGVDAAILFSDILTIPLALGQEVQMVQGVGPVLPQPIRTEADIKKLQMEGALERLDYVGRGIEQTKKDLADRVPLIGFAGAPFTILCYMVEGGGSKNFKHAKTLCFSRPELAHQLLNKITDCTIDYLHMQVDRGADAVQLFDSWSGLLSPDDFAIYAEPYLVKICEAINKRVPVILFPKGSTHAIGQLSRKTKCAISLDWGIQPEDARAAVAPNTVLQGNFDPIKLMTDPGTIRREAQAMVRRFGIQNYIANLGHGMIPEIPVQNAIAFVDAIKSI